jgi:hypothetical protein
MIDNNTGSNEPRNDQVRHYFPPRRRTAAVETVLDVYRLFAVTTTTDNNHSLDHSPGKTTTTAERLQQQQLSTKSEVVCNESPKTQSHQICS